VYFVESEMQGFGEGDAAGAVPAGVIDAAASKISRLELGQSGVRLTDLNLLLDFYG
jgi:hypothetical protein